MCGYKRHTYKPLDGSTKIGIDIKIGCNVICPFLPAKHTADWVGRPYR
ncbi:ArsC [Clostridium botulinum NCTC 2916]|nr:ArsC [Clostridium botulinum NCTC 2916]